MPSLPRPTRCLMLLGLLSVAPGCAPAERIQAQFPPVEDIRAVTEPAPVPPLDILTSSHAASQYDDLKDKWSQGLLDAGRRLCQWTIDTGNMLPFPCKR